MSILSRIELKLNGNCNLNCDYCFEKKNSLIIKEKILIDTMKFYFSKKGYSKKIIILGGEVFLLGEKLLFFLRLIHKVGKDFDIIPEIELITNGTINDFELLRKIIDSKLITELTVSLDGNKEVNSVHRGESYKRIEFFLNFIESNKKLFTNIRLAINKGVTPKNYTSLFKDLLFIRKKFPSFRIRISQMLGIKGWEKVDTNILFKGYIKFLTYVKLFEKDLFFYESFFVDMHRCPNSELSLGLDGKLYNCSFTQELGSNGNFLNYIYDINIEKYNKKYNFLEECKYDLKTDKCITEKGCLFCNDVCVNYDFIDRKELLKKNIIKGFGTKIQFLYYKKFFKNISISIDYDKNIKLNDIENLVYSLKEMRIFKNISIKKDDFNYTFFVRNNGNIVYREELVGELYVSFYFLKFIKMINTNL